MTFAVIGLGKLLTVMYADKSQRIRMMREDLRSERDKANGIEKDKGGDFYVPFWAAAKNHVAGRLDLRAATESRIAAHKGRARLYADLAKGFLVWWEEKRRLRNEPFTVIPENIKARFAIDGLGIVKVENTMAITIGFDGHRIFCPYFSEDPSLSNEAARLGLWVMSQCVTGYELQDMRLLDVIAGRSFSTADTPLQGNEHEIFTARYKGVLDEWYSLKPDYGL